MSPHIPVLLDEVVECFAEISGLFVDCTLGYAGHSNEILKKNKNITLIGCDRDLEAVNFSKKYLENFKERVKIYNKKFSEILPLIDNEKIGGILADIGVSSLQLDKNDRGFGLNSDKLDMRMNQNDEISAYEVVNFYEKSKLEKIFLEYGELSNAKFLAEKICEYRQKKEIFSAKELAQIIGNKNYFNRNIKTAILVFQAIRIEVNSELTELKTLLETIQNSNIKTAKIAIITFHSLEDKIVKSYFKKWASNCKCPPNSIKCECGNNNAIGKIITKKPIIASKNEIAKNPRSSCAKLRIFEINNAK